MTDKANDVVRYELPQKLDTAAASTLQSRLIGASGKNLLLDGSKVEMLGGQCFEVLLNACHHWRLADRFIEITQAAPALVRDLRSLGATLEDIQTGEPS